MTRSLIPLAALTIFMAAICQPAFAEENDTKKNAENLPWEKVSLELGSFLSSASGNVRLSAEGFGIGIDLEEVLGMDMTTTVFRTGAAWRFTDNRRHRAELSWFAFRSDANTQLGQDIIIDGTVIPTGSTVNSSYDLDIYKVSYSYSFLQDDRMDIAAAVGIYVMPVGFTLSASGLVNTYVAESITAPLPVLGLRADFALTPKWFLKTNFDLFYLEYQRFKGSIFDSKAAVEYKAFKNVGFGLAVENFGVHVEAEGEDYPTLDLVGEIEFSYIGAMLYAKIYF